MSDPFSVAAGVAGLICLGGTTSKIFYSFFVSIIDAPASARSLASALFTLNSSFGLVQEVLLDPKFVQQSDDRDIAALEACLVRCTQLFSGIETRLRRSGLVESERGVVKRSWGSVKWVYNTGRLEDDVRQIAEEKATLTLILDCFAARMTAGILGRVEKLQVLAQKQDRRLKDIHVWCQWATRSLDRPKAADESSEYSSFSASQTYTSGDMYHLLQSSGSVLSLQIGDLSDGSVSMILTPDSTSAVTPRRIKSIVSLTKPTIESLKSSQRVMNVTHSPQIVENDYKGSPLQALADLYTLAEKSRSSRSMRRLGHAIEGSIELKAMVRLATAAGFASPFTMGIGELWKSFAKRLESAQTHNHKIMQDLAEIGNLITAIEYVGGDPEIEENLQDLKTQVLEALSEYMNHTSVVLKSRTPVILAREFLGDHEVKRVRLVVNIKRTVEAYKFRHQLCTTDKLLRQQREMIGLQKRKLDVEKDLFSVQEIEGLKSQIDVV